MIVSYLRSSSISNFSFCEHQYFLTYGLGLKSPSNKKADKGTTVHKVMECLALIKKKMQDCEDDVFSIEDDALGVIENIIRKDVLKPYELSDLETETINKTRINKSTYITPCKLPYKSKRYGVDLVEKLIRLSYDYYVEQNSHHEWKPVDFKDCTNWSWMVLEHNNGQFDPRKSNIVYPEPHFDLTIEDDWAKFKYNDPKTNQLIEGNLSIKGTIDCVTDLGDGIYEIVDYKGLPVETEIPTPNGWSTMGDLKIGDLVFDINGNETKVLVKSSKKIKPCYKITFDDKSTVICDNEHLWYLNDGTTVEITKLKIGDTISLTKPIQTKKIDLPIDPYLFGVWLGNKKNKLGEIISGDKFIFDKIKAKGYSLLKNKRKKIKNQKVLYSKTVLNTANIFKELNVLNNKHIPQIYLRASFEQRLDLLRGLLDSEGYINSARKQVVITNSNKKFPEDVKQLLLSLGQKPYQAVNGMAFGLGANTSPIFFKPVDINPFSLPRKHNRVKKEWGLGKSSVREIKSIRKVEDRETQCISVDSPSNTYLCTKNFIPTHNTGQRLDWATGKEKDYKKLQNDTQLLLYHYAAHRLFPEAKQIILTIFFVRDGGPFSMCFEHKDILQLKKILKETFNTIKNCEVPKLQDASQKSFKCTRLCHFYKTKIGKENTCMAIHKDIKKHGIDYVVKKHSGKDFDVNYYESPG